MWCLQVFRLSLKNLALLFTKRKTDKIAYAFTQRIEGYYHGTGDVFASAVTSGVLNGFTLAQSAQIAVDFTAAAILRTKNAGTDIRFGVNFEQEIPSFLKGPKIGINLLFLFIIIFNLLLKIS